MPSDPEMPVRNLRAIYAVKAVALGAILVSFWIVQLFVSPFETGLAITVAVLAALLPTLAVLAASDGASLPLLRASLIIDVLVLGTAVHLTGGVDNVSLPLLYPAIISLTGMLVGRADTFAVALLSAVTYDAVVFGEYAGILPHLVPYSRPPHRQLATVIPVNVFLLLYAGLVSFAMERVRAFYRRTEQMRREAVHTLSHDLKNPLSIIHGYARMLPTADRAERAAIERGLERTAQQALDLVSNVLDAEAIDGRPLKPRPHLVRIDELVRDVAERYAPIAEAARIRLEVESPESTPTAEVDGQLVARAVGNLVSNAIKYGGVESTVRIGAESQNGTVRVRVADRGAGIAPEELPLLFRRYSRAASARGVEGSGLGLYIVRRIAEAHGGSVEVESVRGRGSTFTLVLPASPPKEVSPR